MSLRLTKPGIMAAKLYPAKSPLSGQAVDPIGTLADGTPVWPVLGGAPDTDDPDDPDFVGDDDEDEEDDEEEDKKPKRRPVKKSKSKDDEDEEDEDEEDDDEDEEEDLPPKARASRQAMRYRLEAKRLKAENADFRARLKAIEDKDKNPEELSAEELRTAKEKADNLSAAQQRLVLENAFLRCNVVDWVDADDALSLVDLSDVDVDEDGTVDRRALRAALKDLAKRKPHLVKKPKVSDQDEDEDEDDDQEPRSRRSGAPMNGRRKGSRGDTSRVELAKKFPVLGRR